MPDLDKVIQGLYCCVHNGDCHDCCPYHPIDNGKCQKQTMLADALAMLKAQQARIMRLNEADEAPYVWLESDMGGLGVRRVRIVPEDSTAVAIMAFGLETTFHEVNVFEKHFRCWSEKPTDVQREALKWQ